MWNRKKKLIFIMYRLTASWLPISQRSKLAKKIRGFWGKHIVNYCGKNVNFERNSVFGPELRIGDKVDILGTIELNTFNNPPTIQFVLQDFKKSV